MSKVCSAGVCGPYSFVIINSEGAVVASIRDDDKEIRAEHTEMEVAERWTNKILDKKIGKRNEAY